MLASLVFPSPQAQFIINIIVALMLLSVGLYFALREAPWREVRVLNRIAGWLFIGFGVLALWGAFALWTREASRKNVSNVPSLADDRDVKAPEPFEPDPVARPGPTW